MSKATVIVEGYLSQDPRVNVTQSGRKVANVTVPHTPQRKSQSGQWEDAGPTTWFEATVWEDAAEAVEGLRKGDKVQLVGQLQVETYEKRDGSQGVKAVVKNGTVGLLERGKGGQGGSQGGWATPGGSNNFGPSRGQQTPQAWDESEVPF